MTTPRPAAIRRRLRHFGRNQIGLLTVELFVGLMAVPCGILLAVNGLGMSRDVLKDSPFDTFLVPGLLLTFVVGGSLLSAAFLEWNRRSFAPVASLGAGCVLLGWIVVEGLMIDSGRGLQVAIFGLALLIMGLGWHQRRQIRA